MAGAYLTALVLAGLSLLAGIVVRIAARGITDFGITSARAVDLTVMFLLWAIALMLLDLLQRPGRKAAEEEKPTPPAE